MSVNMRDDHDFISTDNLFIVLIRLPSDEDLIIFNMYLTKYSLL